MLTLQYIALPIGGKEEHRLIRTLNKRADESAARMRRGDGSGGGGGGRGGGSSTARAVSRPAEGGGHRHRQRGAGLPVDKIERPPPELRGEGVIRTKASFDIKTVTETRIKCIVLEYMPCDLSQVNLYEDPCCDSLSNPCCSLLERPLAAHLAPGLGRRHPGTIAAACPCAPPAPVLACLPACF